MNARSSSRARSTSTVPTFSSDGHRQRNYSLAAVETLLASQPPRCSVKRNKHGRITSCQLFPLPPSSSAFCGKELLRKTIYVGQSFSFSEQVDDGGHRAWRHVPLLTPRSEEAELFLMKIFRAVPLSCLPAEHPDAALAEKPGLDTDPEPPPPVISIESRRKRRALSQCDTTELRSAWSLDIFVWQRVNFGGSWYK